jgi:hypothetical protein
MTAGRPDVLIGFGLPELTSRRRQGNGSLGCYAAGPSGEGLRAPSRLQVVYWLGIRTKRSHRSRPGSRRSLDRRQGSGQTVPRCESETQYQYRALTAGGM